MKFSKDDKVLVKSLKRPGTVLEILKSGDVRVAMDGGLTVVCKPSDLAEFDLKSKYAKYKAPPKHHPALSPTKDVRKQESLDLHGVRVVEALALVEKAIDRSIIADLERLEIVHGIGSGKLMQAIHGYLSTCSVVSHFKLDDINPGVTWVYF